jgi:DNA replication and repair protein RecF
VARGVTLVGPHRDDLAIRLEGKDARSYASRGGQRIITLTLRLAEAAAIRRRQATPPVLLLDDGLSELDAVARARLLDWLGEAGQVLLSTTDGVPHQASSATAWAVEPGAVAATDAMLTAGGVG